MLILPFESPLFSELTKNHIKMPQVNDTTLCKGSPCFISLYPCTVNTDLALFFRVAEGSSTSVIARGQCWTPGRVSECRGWPTGRTANRSLLQVKHDHLIGACAVGYNDFDIFWENIKSDPWMDAKLNSKTYIKYFLSRFVRVWLQSLQKVLMCRWFRFAQLAKGKKSRP